MRWWRRKEREQDLDREVRDHLRLEAEEQQEAGMAPDQAFYAAQRAFGNTTLVKEEIREMWGWTSLERLWQDVQYAARAMRRNPAFTLAAVLTLGLGIGVNTAVFAVVRAVVLNPLPFPAADRLVMLWKTSLKNASDRSGVAPADFLDLQQQVRTCSAVAAFTNTLFDVTGVEEPYRVTGARVSANFFSTLGIKPAQGRDFTLDDDQPTAERVAILSHGLWLRRFGGNPDVVGKSIMLNGESYAVVGIMPAHFAFPEIFGPALVPDLWTPLRLFKERDQRGSGYMFVIARLGPGVLLETAQGEMRTLSKQFEAAQPPVYTGKLLTFIPLHQQVVGGVSGLLFVLWGAAGCVLLIACTNLANMLLTRATARRRELAVRASLGASRWRLIRQLLTESVTLAMCGGALGLVLAIWVTHMLPAMGLTSLPRLQEVALDTRILGFGLGLSLLTGLLFGTLPAWQISRGDPQRALQESGRATEGRKTRLLRALFVVVEVSLALVLVTGAGLLVRSFLILQEADLGFQAQKVLTFEISLPGAKYKRAQSPAYYKELLERIASMPQVSGAGAINYLPLTGNVFGWTFLVQEQPTPAGAPIPSAEYRVVSPGFFSALGVSLKNGRVFTEQDKPDGPPVGIINETMARRYWPNEDPIGKQFRLQGPPSMFPWVTVVGIASDVRYEGVDKEPPPTIYRPLQQSPSTAMAVVVRTAASPLSLAGSIRNQVRAQDKDVPLLNVREFGYYVSQSLALRRFLMVLLSGFAGLALFLATLGIYSVVSYSVTQRTQEIGLRIALGAYPHDVLTLVVRQGVILAMMGLTVGLIVTFAFSRVMIGLLYGVAPTDPLTLGAVCAFLFAVTLVGSYLPARRALRVDPIVALRYE
jgi:putative ABC transport system permease protein